MTDPTLIADLIRAGVDPDLVARVSSALTAAAVGAPRGPSKAAIRTQRWRENKASQNVTVTSPVTVENPKETTVTERHQPSQNVTRDVSQDSALTFFLPSTSRKKQEKEEEKKERAKPIRGHALPAEWQPNEKHYCDAYEHLDSGRDWVDSQATDMRIWADTNTHRAVARKTDWDLTFTGWMRRSASQAKGKVNGKQQNSVLAAFDRLERQSELNPSTGFDSLLGLPPR